MPATATTVDFVSNHSAMRVLRRSAEERFLPDGSKAVVKPEVVYEFQGRRLAVRPNQDLIADKWDGEEFVEQDAVEYLRSHPDHGVRFYEHTPTAPEAGPLFEQITDALIAGDATVLEAIGNEEFSTWNRPEVMDRVRGALDKIAPADPPPDED